MIYRCLVAWEGEAPVGWNEVLGIWQVVVFAGNLFMLAECPIKVQQRRAIFWRVAREGDLHFGTGFLGASAQQRGSLDVRLSDGKARREKHTYHICLGIAVDPKGSNQAAVRGKGIAAQKTWFSWRGAFLSKVASAQARTRKSYWIEGAAYLYGVRVWALESLCGGESNGKRTLCFARYWPG